jgi:hypothetical protein
LTTESISRRTLLDSAIHLACLPAGIAFFAAWTQAAQHDHGSSAPGPEDATQFENYKPQFFAPDDFEALQSFTEILIPTDETPGAKEAYCAQFIDFVLYSSAGYAESTRQQWREAIDALRKAGFHSAAPERRRTLVAEFARPEQISSAHHPAFAAYLLIKRENAFAFYTARAGCIEALDYRGNSVNLSFPACTHPEHQRV